MKYYVNQNAKKFGLGTKEEPFKTIQEAADIAKPGDEVLVYPGIYREAVNPINAGTMKDRIIYRSVEPKKAMISGAEKVDNWKSLGDGVWQAVVSNELFEEYNPYNTLVYGDWFIATFIAHTGDVYLNEKSMYEVTDLEGVRNPKVSMASWDRDFSVYTWHAEVKEKETVFTANFHEYDPNKENVEISVRRNCFYPQSEGIDYITLSGFTVCKAATQWAPPTAYQEGMIGPHWSKEWIIEDCEVYESKCSGISLGKYYQKENDNKWSKWKFKDGTQTERDCICQAQREGWLKERIGHHTIRRCVIHDCGQTGIVGHLGGVFSLIEDNHIYNINNKQNLAGAEIGGIKMHAAIDVIYRRNHIHHCTRGLWLDWQAQGTRVTQNLFHDNALPELPTDMSVPTDEVTTGHGEDIFIEVSHGPTLVDNNILLSTRSVKLATQGVALVHNLIGGALTAVGRGTDNGSKTIASPRYTPYHVPHRTEIAGFMTILHGDMRFYNNIFIQQEVHPVFKYMFEHNSERGAAWDDQNYIVGTHPYDDGYPTYEEWSKLFEGYCGMGSDMGDAYYNHLPVWAAGNAYFNGAKAWKKEQNAHIDNEHKIYVNLDEKDGVWTLSTNVYEFLPENMTELVETQTLGMAFEPEEAFEHPDGRRIVFDADLLKKRRGEHPTPGPLESRAGTYQLEKDGFLM